MKNLIKKYWLILFLIIIAMLLIFIKLTATNQQIPTPQIDKIPSPKFNPVSVTNQTINYQFNLSLPTNLPTSLPVYKMSSLATNAYADIQPDLMGTPIVSTDPMAIDIANKFLNTKGIDNNLLQKSGVSYLKVSHMNVYPATNSAQIDIYSVDFWPQQDGLMIVPGQPNASLNYVWIGKNGKIQKAFSTSFSLTKDKDLSLRSITTAEQDIIQQKGALVWLDTKNSSEGYSPLTINNISFDNVTPAYFLPSQESKLLEPIYIFIGKASIQGEDNPISAALYLPAIEEKFLSF